MMELWNYGTNWIYKIIEDLKAARDPRTAGWFLINHDPQYCLGISCAYLSFVKCIGPNVMANRKPFHLQVPMVLYNMAMSFLSMYIVAETLSSCMELGYFKNDFLCAPYNASTIRNPKELRLANVMWWYFFSKALELMDTLFMVLRKKEEQVTFLHVFHHISMFLMWWLALTYFPGGQVWFAVTLNSCVHVIMYLYYALAAIPSMKKHLWWKKHLTKLQLVQFMLTLCHTLYTTVSGCDYPLYPQILLELYMVIMLILFGNFYFRSYNTTHLRTEQRHRHVLKDTNGCGANHNLQQLAK